MPISADEWQAMVARSGGKPFNAWRFIFPPRTKMVLPPGPSSARTMWETLGDTVGQYKLNGSRNLTVIHPGGKIELWGRGKSGQAGTLQKQFTVTPAMRANIERMGLDRDKLHVLDGEFIHAKTKQFKDVLYLFDILIYNSTHLLGWTGQHRYDLLHRVANDAKIAYFPIYFHPREGQMYLAKCEPPTEWESMWRLAQAQSDFCEGVVIKRMGAASALEYGGQEYNNSGWMTRLRKPKANYAH